jgi:hypothetical protein
MGLDIRGHFNHVALPEDDEEANVYYKWGDEWADREDGAIDGPHTAETVGHACLSYSGYSSFRRAMAQAYLGITLPDQGEWPQPENTDDPLWKLIWYADNEGVFGPFMTKRVAARLNELDPSAMASEWHRSALEDWKACFNAAAAYDDGCVEWG